MEKLYNDTQYAEAAIEANAEGKFLYRYQHEVEYEAEVLEWNFVEQEVERQKIDPETGEPMYDEEGNPVVIYIEDDLEYAAAAKCFSEQLSKH